jgi:kynurenine 3-monooxygenase
VSRNGNSPSRAQTEALIVGAGLVGSLLAIYLARRGHTVEVWERHADLRRADFPSLRSSINLSLCERGFQALERVGVREQVQALAVPSYGRLIHGEDCELAFQPYGDHGEATYSLLRNDLNALLIDVAESLGVVYHFEEKCLDIDLEAATVQFKNTRTDRVHTASGDVVFGADGVFSAIRARLQKTIGFNYSQQYLKHGYTELNIPAVRDGRWGEQPSAVHLWPRGHFMLLGLPNLDGSLVCSLHLPLDGANPSFDSLTDEESLKRFLRGAFPDVADLLSRSAEQFFNRRTNYLVTIRCFPWTHGGRVSLIGDSAHAIVPFYAQGVNSGFEDCLVLDQCLDETADDWAKALSLFERRRKPDTDAIADLSLQNFEELRDHVGQGQFQLKKKIERRLAELYQNFVPVYSRVTFQAAPYSEALRHGRDQEKLLQKIMALPAVSRATEPELTSLIRQVVDSMPFAWLGASEARPARTVSLTSER